MEWMVIILTILLFWYLSNRENRLERFDEEFRLKNRMIDGHREMIEDDIGRVRDPTIIARMDGYICRSEFCRSVQTEDDLKTRGKPRFEQPIAAPKIAGGYLVDGPARKRDGKWVCPICEAEAELKIERERLHRDVPTTIDQRTMDMVPFDVQAYLESFKKFERIRDAFEPLGPGIMKFDDRLMSVHVNSNYWFKWGRRDDSVVKEWLDSEIDLGFADYLKYALDPYETTPLLDFNNLPPFFDPIGYIEELDRNRWVGLDDLEREVVRILASCHAGGTGRVRLSIISDCLAGGSLINGCITGSARAETARELADGVLSRIAEQDLVECRGGVKLTEKGEQAARELDLWPS